MSYNLPVAQNILFFCAASYVMDNKGGISIGKADHAYM
jgi:hypothetical protein